MRRNRIFPRFLRPLCLVFAFLSGAGVCGAAYGWYVASRNEDNRVTVARTEIALEAETSALKYFETELTPLEGTAFAPADYAEAKARATELGGNRIAESVVVLRSASDRTLDYRISLDDSAYENPPALRASVFARCYDADTGEVRREETSFGAFGEVQGSVGAGERVRLHFFLYCAPNGFAEGQTLRFDLSAHAETQTVEQPLPLENGGFEAGDAGWTSLVSGYPLSVFLKDGADVADQNREGETLVDCRNFADAGFRSSEFVLSGSGLIRFKLAGVRPVVKVFRADGTQIAEYAYDVPYEEDGYGIYVLRTYVADLSAHLGERLYLELWFEEDGGLADDFVTDDENASDYPNRFDGPEKGFLDWILLENRISTKNRGISSQIPRKIA